MSLRGFRYLHRSRTFTLIVILTLTSTLFLVTAFSFFSFYNGFTNYIGEETDVVAIHSNIGSTPLTAIVPTYLADYVRSIDGVLASSPEVIAPVSLDDHAVFVRGISLDEFTKLNDLHLLQGELLDMNDGYGAVVGKDLAERLNLKVGDSLLVFGVISQTYVELTVKGVFQSDSVMDDEILVPIYVGQWLRGVNYNYVSFIRVKLDYSLTNVDYVYREIAQNVSSPTPSPGGTKQPSLRDLIPYGQISFQIGDIGIESTQDLMQDFLNNYGVTKNTLVLLSVVVLFFASGTAVCALAMFLEQHRREIGIIRMVGASERRIKLDLILKVLSWSVISSLLGVGLAYGVMLLFNQVSYLQVLSHNVSLTLDPLLIAVNFVIVSLLVTVQIWRSDVKH